jgi:hypothetical protein
VSIEIVPSGPPQVRFVMLESAATGAALVIDRMSDGPALRLWRNTDPQGMYVAGRDLVIGQIVEVAAGTTGRVEVAQ